MRIVLGTDQEMVGNWSRQLEIGDTKRQRQRERETHHIHSVRVSVSIIQQ